MIPEVNAGQSGTENSTKHEDVGSRFVPGIYKHLREQIFLEEAQAIGTYRWRWRTLSLLGLPIQLKAEVNTSIIFSKFFSVLTSVRVRTVSQRPVRVIG